jgi:hypothetical protein
MAKRYVVAEGHEFNYPADLASLQKILQHGGRTKMTKEELRGVKFKTVKAGEDCSDMPPGSLDIFVQRGWVVEKEEEKVNG